MEILLVVHGILMLFEEAIESEALTKKNVYMYINTSYRFCLIK